ncbi:MAG: HAMP domain-containing protein [Chloroflexi bacterium]|nr:HAMP domain-containing protein [Chloroflexota bacterium]
MTRGKMMGNLLSFLDNMRLQTRISLLVGFGLVAVLGLLTFLSLRVVQETTDDILHERLVLAGVVASYVDTILDDNRRHLAALPSLASFDPHESDLSQERQAMVGTYAQIGSYTEGLMLLDTQGKIILSVPSDNLPVGTDLSSETGFQEILTASEPSISNAFRFRLTGKPTLAMALPVKNGSGKVVSILCILIYLDSSLFTDVLDPSSRFSHTGHADIVDSKGKVVASTARHELLMVPDHPAFYRQMLSERKAQVKITSGSDNTDQPNSMHVMAYVPLKSAPWGLGLGATEQETFAPVRRVQLQSGILGLLSVLVALAMGWFSTKKVVRPVETLITASERMASGDLGTPVKVEGGDEVGRLAAAFDEMRLKLQAAYHALTVEKSQYQGIFLSMADPVFTTDASSQITSLNPAAERMIGLSAAEAVGLPCSDILKSRDGAGVRSCQASCPLLPGADWREASSISTEVVCGRQGNNVVEAARAPIYDDEGALVGVVHVLRDISAQEELSEMKEQFISNVSHELRSPLGFVKGYVTTLLRKDAQWGEKMRRNFLREILRASDRLEHLVNELLDLSRVRALTFNIECQPVQLRPVVHAAVKWVKVQPSQHKFVVSLPRKLPRVLANAERTEQVLRNLLENAVKYSPDGGRIGITGLVEDGMVIISVSDEGIGVPVERLENIFERFHRVDSSLAAKIGGVGIGLSICRSIVEAQGGRIWVASTYGEGSTFHFSVPVHEEARRSSTS